MTADSGERALNLWRGWSPGAGGVTPFLALTEHIFQRMRLEDRDLPLKLVAYKAQNPQIKIPLAIVMVGPQGGGKSLWGDCVRQAFAPYGQTISAEQMVGQFGGWKEKTLLAQVNEVGGEVFRNNSEMIRNLISDLRVPMEEKFRPTREINCYTFFIINSNRRAVSSYDVDDRRMVVVDTPPPRERAFYSEIGAWLKAGGAKDLLGYLLRYPLAGWEPPQRAPMSDEKHMAYKEGLSAVQELAHSMLTARVNMVEAWLASAEQWARRAEVSSNPYTSQMGQAVTESLATMQIKPWYTPQELAMLFPTVVEQTLGSRFNKLTPAGQISRELREAGIPYLRCADNPEGFWHRGQLKQYLIVSDFEEWSRPLAQSEFDRLVNSFPTWPEYKRMRMRK